MSLKSPGDHLCPYDERSPYRRAWLDGFAACQREWVDKRLAQIAARYADDGGAA